ncbi:D-aminoacyl-tRNA deacylase [Linum perenne]
MVTLLVATTSDPASINPANALLAISSGTTSTSAAGPPLNDIQSFIIGNNVRLLQHGKSIVEEDDLDLRWQAATGETVDEVIFFSKHVAASNRPALTIHPIGVPHMAEGEVLPQGGKPGWAAPPDPRIGPWIRLLKRIAESRNLVPEFEIHLLTKNIAGSLICCSSLDSVGSTDEYWNRQDAAEAIAQLVWEGLGLGGGSAVGNWSSENNNKRVLLGIGGGHYAPRHMDIVMKDDNVWVAHLLSGYSLPMDDPNQAKGGGGGTKDIGGTWKQSIIAAVEATRLGFPGGEILAHLDHKSFKGWQKNAITAFLGELNIRIGKPNDFH